MPTYDFNGTLRLMMASAKRQPQPKSSISRDARLLMPIRWHMYSSSRNPVSAGGPIARTVGLFRLNFSGTTNTPTPLTRRPYDLDMHLATTQDEGRRKGRYNRRKDALHTDTAKRPSPVIVRSAVIPAREGLRLAALHDVLCEMDQLWRKRDGGVRRRPGLAGPTRRAGWTAGPSNLRDQI